MIVRSGERKTQLIEMENLLDTILNLLDEENVGVRRVAATFVRNLSVNSEDRKRIIVEAGAIAKLAKSIDCSRCRKQTVRHPSCTVYIHGLRSLFLRLRCSTAVCTEETDLDVIYSYSVG